MAEQSVAQGGLKERLEDLEANKSNLLAQVQSLSKEKDSALAKMEAMRESLGKAENVSQVKAELEAQHQVEVEGLQKELSEMGELKKTVTEVEGLRASVSELKQKNTELATQVEKCSSLESQVTSLTQKLEAEQADKNVSEPILHAPLSCKNLYYHAAEITEGARGSVSDCHDQWSGGVS